MMGMRKPASMTAALAEKKDPAWWRDLCFSVASFNPILKALVLRSPLLFCWWRTRP